MSSEKKEEGLGAFFGGLLCGAVAAGIVAIAAAVYACNERDRDVAQNDLCERVSDASYKANLARLDYRSISGAHNDLVERVEKLEAKHRCQCGENCACEKCECEKRQCPAAPQ